jgi:hypothetical protein
MKCANLGIDDSPELLGGWWTSLKRGASAVTSSTISAVKDSGIPGFSQAAGLVRSAGQTAEEQGWIPSTLRTGGSSAAPAATPAYYAPAKDNTLLYVGLGALAIVLLAKK